MKKIITLDNGMGIAIVPYSKATDIGLAVAFNGSVFEEENGITHFIEHMMIRRCAKFPNFVCRGRALDRYTRNNSPGTDHRAMVISFEIDPKHFSEAVKLVRCLIKNPMLKRDVIELEADSISVEKARDNDNCEITLTDFANSFFFQNGSASREILGSVDKLKVLPISKFREVHSRMVSGHRMTVVVTGDVKTAFAERSIVKNFSSFSAGTTAQLNISKKRRRRERVLIAERSSSIVYISVTFPIPYTYNHPDRIAFSAMKTHLVGLESSVLYAKLVGELGLVYFPSIDAWYTPRMGRVMITTATNPANTMKILSAIFETLRALRNGNLSGEDLHLAAQHLKNKVRDLHCYPEKESAFFAEQLLATGEIITCDDYIREVNELGVKDVIRVAKRVLRPENAWIVLLGPVGQDFKKNIYTLLRKAG